MHKLFFYTIALVLLLVSPVSAQELTPKTTYTKEAYLRDCKGGRTTDFSAFCACHFEVTMDFRGTWETKRNENEIEKLETNRQGILARLKKYPAVTAVNLEQVCKNTNPLFWDIRTEMQALHKHKTPEAKARKVELSKALVVGKAKANDIFMAYKQAHGMLTTKHGHVFDEGGKWVSTDNYMSYCIPLNKLAAIKAEMNGPMRIYAYQAQSINKSPDKHKCTELVPNSLPAHRK